MRPYEAPPAMEASSRDTAHPQGEAKPLSLLAPPQIHRMTHNRSQSLKPTASTLSMPYMQLSAEQPATMDRERSQLRQPSQLIKRTSLRQRGTDSIDATVNITTGPSLRRPEAQRLVSMRPNPHIRQRTRSGSLLGTPSLPSFHPNVRH